MFQIDSVKVGDVNSFTYVESVLTKYMEGGRWCKFSLCKALPSL